jgi:hypothetical protein
MALVGLDSPDLDVRTTQCERPFGCSRNWGARPELGRSHVAHARVFAARGERDRAKDPPASAIAIFRALGMTWDLQRAELDLQRLCERPGR